MVRYKNLIIIAVLFAIGIIIVSQTGIVEKLNLESILELRDEILAYGTFAVVLYFLLYILGTLFMFPGLPLTLLGSALFGPLWGTIYTVCSASLGLGFAFLVARYAVRGLILGKFGNSSTFTKIDDGVENEGWRILMITRLVPIFPFNLQNYIYGLTKINFFQYWILSTIFIIPGTSAYTLSFGAVLSGEFSSKNLIYLGVGAVCFVLISFIPKFIKPKNS